MNGCLAVFLSIPIHHLIIEASSYSKILSLIYHLGQLRHQLLIANAIIVGNILDFCPTANEYGEDNFWHSEQNLKKEKSSLIAELIKSTDLDN